LPAGPPTIPSITSDPFSPGSAIVKIDPPVFPGGHLTRYELKIVSNCIEDENCEGWCGENAQEESNFTIRNENAINMFFRE
jgi:hypothetical protein